MFVPPASSAGESTGHRLKKILIFNGLGSWAPLKPGRDLFTQARCPVDTCTITPDKAQAADADAILYKDHFVNPGHPRPPRQVRDCLTCTSCACWWIAHRNIIFLLVLLISVGGRVNARA
jgi:hypothetical protein